MNGIDEIEKNLPHTVSEVICVKCFKRWISVRLSGVWLKDLECPNCGKGYVIETGQFHRGITVRGADYTLNLNNTDGYCEYRR
jgi:hypothetical protein